MKANKSDPHIIFVYAPASATADEYRRTHFKMCLGSAYIIAYLTQGGFTAQQFVVEDPINVSQCAARICSKEPRVVGFTVDNPNYHICQLIARELKTINPKVIVLFGGIVPTIHHEVILKNNPFVDICSRNESEETCLELLSRLEDARFDLIQAALDTVKGITYQIRGEIFKTPDRDVFLSCRKIPDFLDKYPSPYLSGVAYSSKMGIITARGCNQNCIYCICPTLSKRIIVTHSVDRVIEELDYIARNFVQDNIPVIDIFDDTFTLLPKRAMKICQGIIENKIRLPLACITRCDKMNEELLEAMKEAGFKSIEFSLESAVPRVLRLIGKVQHPNTTVDNDFEKEKEFVEKFKRYAVYAKKIGIENVITSVMLGLPTETPEEGRQTMNLIHSVLEHIDFYAHNDFVVYPGTAIFSNWETYGYKLEQFDDQVHYKTIPAYDTGEIPLAPKSNLQMNGIRQDKDTIKTLALTISKNSHVNLNYFNKIILCADIITKELISWLQTYLALNGSFIHLYSCFDQAKRYHRQNEHALKKYTAPTNCYTSYYQSIKKEGIITLVPFRTYFLGDQCGIPIHLVSTKMGLTTSNIKINPRQFICVDDPTEKEDALQLHRCLFNRFNRNKIFEDLFDCPVYPYFSSLCRWEKGLANCQSLETLIVDADNNVKICWTGEVIGKVGIPFPGIVEHLRNLQKEAENKRECRNCHEQPVCTRCVFPAPLSASEYCDLKRNFNTGEPAGLIRMLDLFKELN